MTNNIIREALRQWGLDGADFCLAAARENHVFKVESGDRIFALRIHRRGYRTDRELASELDWLAAAADGGLSVPRPVPTLDGDMLTHHGGYQIDMVNWLGGETLVKATRNVPSERRAAIFQDIGVQAARLHEICDNWTLPPGFHRCAWDRDGLLGRSPLWGRFWENTQLSRDDAVALSDFRAQANRHLASIEQGLDFGLIHADLIEENVLVDGDAIRLIDFDDGGYGFRLFEIATALIKQIDAPDFDQIRSACIRGYRSVRRLNVDTLDLFLALRATTYIGWIDTRRDLPDADQRQQTNARRAKRLVDRYLAGSAIDVA